MLILVGVTVNVALNSGLFGTAKDAKTQTQLAMEKEILQAEVLGAYNAQTRTVDKAKLQANLSDWTIDGDGPFTCTSPKGNVFTVALDGTISNEENGGGAGGTVPATYQTTISGLGEGVTLVPYASLTGAAKTAADAGKISAVIKETITLNGTQTEATAVVPTGYTVSTNDLEDSIGEGLITTPSERTEGT